MCEVAGSKVCAEGLVDEVAIEVIAERVSCHSRRDADHGGIEALEVEATRDDLSRAFKVGVLEGHSFLVSAGRKVGDDGLRGIAVCSASLGGRVGGGWHPDAHPYREKPPTTKCGHL